MLFSPTQQTFENYVVGSFNKMAFSVLNSFGDNASYNFVFLSGGVGCGKTHLLNSVVNKLKKVKKVKYLGSEDLIRDFWKISSDGGGSNLDLFFKEVCSYDVLLIDDVQFFLNKERCLEFLWSVIDEYIRIGKFLVFSSDKNINDLIGFDKRLKSRMSSGIVVSILRPDLESLRIICGEKIKFFNEAFFVNAVCVDFLIRRCNYDVRVLDGLVSKVFFFASSLLPPKSVISIDFLEKIFKESGLSVIEKGVDEQEIIKFVCDLYNTSVEEVKSEKRNKQIVLIRSVCMYMLKKKIKGISLLKIGSFFNNKSHSVVLDSIKKIEKIINSDEKMKFFIEKIASNI